jgi:hypothetical protein
MRTVFFIPPLKKPSGGLTAIEELASLLARNGLEVAVAAPQGAFPETRELDAAIPRLPWDASGRGAFLARGDIWCVPESWPNALAQGVNAGASSLVYVQSWIYLLTALPEGVQWKRLPARYLAVSQPVSWFMKEMLGISAEAVLPPAVHPVFFTGGRKVENPVRIAWMPRKNKALAGMIRSIALACLGEARFERPVDFVEIHGLSRAGAAALLSGCHLFLSSGFPEGFGLPPVEAMASGCVPVGFSGLGGFEYMRNPEPHPLAGLYSPPFALPGKPWGGNGFFVADGDVVGAGRALAHAVRLASAGGAAWEELVRNCRLTAQAYCAQARETLALRIWDELRANIAPCIA